VPQRSSFTAGPRQRADWAAKISGKEEFLGTDEETRTLLRFKWGGREKTAFEAKKHKFPWVEEDR